jgi:hypothetical protein
MWGRRRVDEKVSYVEGRVQSPPSGGDKEENRSARQRQGSLEKPGGFRVANSAARHMKRAPMEWCGLRPADGKRATSRSAVVQAH